ncbi:MAG TPA: 1,4-dihydroxy-2-naphthoate polyprenyltransferase [Acidimicrobiales bacterium]|nr:1,4-dihydroxy-2-naphthoate polyprenyltransferase [Acidimicrobiales bacterium]
MNRWVAGARPRTLPAAVVPVAVGTGIAVHEGGAVAWRAGCALVVSLALQVATNYANDYRDGIRGTDEARVGPVRLVASGLAAPAAVKRAAFAAFAVAAVAGLVLTVAVGPELIFVGVAAIAAGWFYTGGPRPYGYAGFGELFVFVFFGLVATAGTTYVQLERFPAHAVVASVAVGLLATALLVVNNLRDIDGDRVAGKTTLAVRIGRVATRRVYAICALTPFAVAAAVGISRPGALVALMAIPLAIAPVRRVLAGTEGRELIACLQATATLHLCFGALFAAGLSW